ncbi:hypothetical protein [Pseudarthrobacter sulfonivorans]|nr:hypothetical protein [Pseudarthrobacter sulfonivorans]MDR6413466.1 hypothetical protein [Pseudarthrobacter sulfonivorans]
MLRARDEPDEALGVVDEPQVWETLHESLAAYMSGTSPAHDEVLIEGAD